MKRRARGCAAAVLAGSALAPAPMWGQSLEDLRAAVQADANTTGAVASLPFRLDGQTGTLRFDAPIGLCRAFVLMLPHGAYSGRVCRVPGTSGWRVESFTSLQRPADQVLLQPRSIPKAGWASFQPAPAAPPPAPKSHAHAFPPPHEQPFIFAPAQGGAAAPGLPGGEPASLPPNGAAPYALVQHHQHVHPIQEGAAFQPPAPVHPAATQAPPEPQLIPPYPPAAAGQAAQPAELPKPLVNATQAVAVSPAHKGPVSAQSASELALFQSMPIRYNSPPTISFDHDTTIGFVVEGQGAGTSAAMLDNLPGASVSGSEALTPDVVVRLRAPEDEVAIAARTPDQQHVTTMNNTFWFWDVRARKPGSATLTLTVEPLDAKGRSLRPHLVYINRIKVQIAPISLLTYWISVINPIYKFLGLGTPVALIAGAWAFWRKQAKHPA